MGKRLVARSLTRLLEDWMMNKAMGSALMKTHNLSPRRRPMGLIAGNDSWRIPDVLWEKMRRRET